MKREGGGAHHLENAERGITRINEVMKRERGGDVHSLTGEHGARGK
jgi:hypothetical protein